MRIITHNLLQCNIRGVTNGYPLIIEAEKIEIIPTEFDLGLPKNTIISSHSFILLELTQNTVQRIDFKALKVAANSLSIPFDFEMLLLEDGTSAQLTTEQMENEELMRKLHHLIFEVNIIEGNLVCPESSRKFPVRDGIPNMLLHEDEV